MTIGELKAIIDGITPAILKSIEDRVTPLAKDLQALKEEVEALRKQLETGR